MAKNQEKKKLELWGRATDATVITIALTLGLFAFAPFWAAYLWASCTYYQCSITTGPIVDFFNVVQNFQDEIVSSTNGGLIEMIGAGVYKIFTDVVLADREALCVYLCWLVYNFAMYLYFPVRKIGLGQSTPAGHVLKYRINGLYVWIATHVVYIAGSVLSNEAYGLDYICVHWGGFLVATNIVGLALSLFVYMKAHIAPSHPEDRKFSGSKIYDYCMGIELNPRIGQWFDFKLVFNGRPGIVAWTLINFSFGAAQYKQLGYVTNAMVLLNILHAIYVVDFFYFEDWYLRTIDIAHDHFGYYLAWGDCVWLPFTYTLQSFYIFRNPVDLSTPYFILILSIGLVGYYIFRNANNQKDIVRKTNGRCLIFGKPPTFIRAEYRTADGKPHKSILLTCGFWGLSRHFNYVGDLLMCFAFGASCASFDFIPFYYLFYMTVLLVHRISRDNDRCRLKYGVYWDEYCRRVPYKLIPYVY
ncbi:7-dehydrocholesterol reductase [Zancudomyces culisetae]|uniref:7-dehydrocholesterol reductase n=1 Tax=Zancudomyces culisetae TaxID=1213189 RepID=A0A1R1PXT1_ZANCU|nr:7-dehydrocholesterol reductase [Zancudomyces culisetae]|eukprot:OMH85727.1 7-dehydrocholesterol reductase [Zancudomyces culisetae]